MQIILNSTKKIVFQEEKSKDINSLTVRFFTDSPSEKVVKCYTHEIDDEIILWEGDDYDTIGQWTDTDAQNRLLEIYNS